MDVVRGGAGVAAQQLSSVFTHPTELHVVVILLLGADGDPHPAFRYHPFLALLLEILKVLVLRLPLDPLLFLGKGNIDSFR